MDNEMEALTVAGLIGCLIEPSSFLTFVYL